MSPFEIKHLDHIVLRVEDMQASLDFYTRTLGCPIRKRRDDLGMIHLGAGTSMIDLVDAQGPLGRQGGGLADPRHRNLDHFCLRIEPFDEAALIAHLQSFGLTVEQAARRFGAEGYGLSLYCFDPDGNQVELKGPSESDQPAVS